MLIVSIITQFNPCKEFDIIINNNSSKYANSNITNKNNTVNITFYKIACQVKRQDNSKIFLYYDNYDAYFNIFIKNILIL